MNKPICYGIIPARFGSTRFPGKPLADILGKPMFWHVYSRAKMCPEFTDVLLATDDERIADVAKSMGVPYVMTSDNHQSGSDRVFEVACKLNLPDDVVLVNVQGDEPALNPSVISVLLRPFFEAEDVQVSTLAHPISEAEAENPNKVKIALAFNNDALYFSRATIPYNRNQATQGADFLGHIGIYAYRLKALKLFTSWSPSPLELREGLEQLRFLENNIPIRVGIVSKPSQAVDVFEDIAKVEQVLLSEQSSL